MSSRSRLPRKLIRAIVASDVLRVTFSFLSKLIIYWLSPLLRVGFSRPLEIEGKPSGFSYYYAPLLFFPLAPDLWRLPSNRLAAPMTAEFEAHLYARYPPEERPPRLRHLSSPSGKHDRSLLRAVHAAYWKRIWIAGSLRFIAALTPTFSAFVTRALLSWLTSAHAWHTTDSDRRNEVELYVWVLLSTAIDHSLVESSAGSGLWYRPRIYLIRNARSGVPGNVHKCLTFQKC